MVESQTTFAVLVTQLCQACQLLAKPEDLLNDGEIEEKLARLQEEEAVLAEALAQLRRGAAVATSSSVHS